MCSRRNERGRLSSGREFYCCCSWYFLCIALRDVLIHGFWNNNFTEKEIKKEQIPQGSCECSLVPWACIALSFGELWAWRRKHAFVFVQALNLASHYLFICFLYLTCRIEMCCNWNLELSIRLFFYVFLPLRLNVIKVKNNFKFFLVDLTTLFPDMRDLLSPSSRIFTRVFAPSLQVLLNDERRDEALALPPCCPLRAIFHHAIAEVSTLSVEGYFRNGWIRTKVQDCPARCCSVSVKGANHIAV